MTLPNHETHQHLSKKDQRKVIEWAIKWANKEIKRYTKLERQGQDHGGTLNMLKEKLEKLEQDLEDLEVVNQNGMS